MSTIELLEIKLEHIRSLHRYLTNVIGYRLHEFSPKTRAEHSKAVTRVEKTGVELSARIKELKTQ